MLQSDTLQPDNNMLHPNNNMLHPDNMLHPWWQN